MNKICIACGMPMQEPSQFAMGDTTKDYCVYCAKPDGSMQGFEEKKAGLANLYVKTQGIDKEAALQQAEAQMRTLPAWQSYF